MSTPLATALWHLLVALISITAAQTEANCTEPQYNWMFNSVGLSPCHVADQLAEPCVLLVPGDAYFLPTNYQNNTCICNSVFYSLLSACGACQNGTWVSWASFTMNCTTTSLTVYPNPIPSGAKVPHWAYLNVNDTGSFNVIDAEDAGGSDSTSLAGATSTSSTPTSTSSSQSSSSAGPIAGGVVGGVVGLVLITGVAVCFYRMGRRGQHRSDKSNDLMGGPDVLTSPLPTAWNASSLVPAFAPQKLYDPQDPSTFPANTYTSPLVAQSLIGTTLNTTCQDVHQPIFNATRYTGIPEV